MFDFDGRDWKLTSKRLTSMLRALFGDCSGQMFPIDITFSVDGEPRTRTRILYTVPPETPKEKKQRERYEALGWKPQERKAADE